MNSQIILAKNIRIDREYKNVLSYNHDEMLALVSKNKVVEANDYSFIRQSKNSISTNFTYEQCLEANYMAFRNKDYSNKWFFAWIDDVIWKGDKCTEIRFTVDAWSTYFGEWTPQRCFVIRHHVNDDTIGINTVNENLDVGEVVEEQESEDVSLSEFYYIGVLSSWNVETKKQFAGISVYNKQIYGNQLYLFDTTNAPDTTGFKDLISFLIETNSDGHIADIDSIFIIPASLVKASDLEEHIFATSPQESKFYTLKYTFEAETYNTQIDKRHSFSDYTPKNNKLFCYPYNYLLITNNAGNYNILKYEDFSTEKVNLETQMAIGVGNSIRLVPRKYKKQDYAIDEAISLCKYPTCGWSADAYTNWLTSQAVNIPTRLVMGTASSLQSAEPVSSGLSIAGNIARNNRRFLYSFTYA